MIEYINWLVDNWDNILVAMAAIVGVVSAFLKGLEGIVNLTPTNADNEALKAVLQFLDKVALNLNREDKNV